MHIEALKVFCDVFETQSLTLAAERNYVTPSAIGQQIRVFEVKFGRKFLDTGSRLHKINPTPAGEVFYKQCKRVLASFAKLESGMDGQNCMMGKKVRVVTPYCVGRYDLPTKMGEFMAKVPAARIDLVYNRAKQVISEVLEETAEIGVVAFPEPDRRLTCLPMPGERMVLVCSTENKLANRRQIRANDLNALPLVSFERGTPTRKATDKILASHGVSIKQDLEFGNLESIKSAVALGFGVAIVPKSCVLKEQNSQQLAVLNLAGKEWERPIGVIFRSNKTLSIPAKKFIQSLVNDTY